LNHKRLNDQNEFIDEMANMKVSIDKIKSGLKSDFRKLNSEISELKSAIIEPLTNKCEYMTHII